jgi:hypothetical protein
LQEQFVVEPSAWPAKCISSGLEAKEVGMVSAVWQDKAFRYQWTNLPHVLRRGELQAGLALREAFWGLSEELCQECDESSRILGSAGEAVRSFLETCVAKGHLSSVPDGGMGDAITALQHVAPPLARDLTALLAVRRLARDAFAGAKAAVVREIVDGLDLERTVWAVAYEAGLIHGEKQGTATLSVEARCLLLALARIGPGRVRQLHSILNDAVGPQDVLSSYIQARITEDVLVPGANNGNQPAALRALCALAVLAISNDENEYSAGQIQIRDLEGAASLGVLGVEIWKHCGDLPHGSREAHLGEEDFGEWFDRAFSHVKYAVEALGPVVLPREAPESPPPDRRNQPRVETINLVNVASFSVAGLRTDMEVGRTLDLSRDGMRLEMHHHVRVRSVLVLSLALAGRLVEVHGTVRSLEVLQDNVYALGIQFLDLPRESRNAIDLHLRGKGRLSHRSLLRPIGNAPPVGAST